MYGEPPRTAMLPAAVSTDGQPPRRRLTLSIRAALAAIAVYAGALVMLALSSWYDLENLGYELWAYPAIGLFVTGVLLLVMAASTGAPVLIGGAALATIVLLLPSTRRDLRARQGATG